MNTYLGRRRSRLQRFIQQFDILFGRSDLITSVRRGPIGIGTAHSPVRVNVTPTLADACATPSKRKRNRRCSLHLECIFECLSDLRFPKGCQGTFPGNLAFKVAGCEVLSLTSADSRNLCEGIQKVPRNHALNVDHVSQKTATAHCKLCGA